MIAIPNTEMPKGCIDCPVNDMVCELWTEVANIKAHKHKDCPLIEIVRCGECKWGDTGIDEEGKPFWKCLGIHYGGTRPTDFCSYGERRTDETDR